MRRHPILCTLLTLALGGAWLAEPAHAARCVGATTATVGAYSRVIWVDPSGRGCDFTDLSEALTWVATRTRAATSQWLVIVNPGHNGTTYNYAETSLAVPSYTTVTALAGANRPLVKLSGATGSLLTLAVGAGLDNLRISAGGDATATGAVKVVASTGATSSLSNVSISVGSTFGDGSNVDLISNDAGTMTLYRVDLSKTGTATKVRLLVNGASGTAINYALGTWTAGTSQAKGAENLNASGSINLTAVTIATAATADFAGTTGPITTRATIGTTSGTVTPASIQATDATVAGKLYVAQQTPASAGATCTANQVAFDTGYLYICTATNTWKRVAIATWP